MSVSDLDEGVDLRSVLVSFLLSTVAVVLLDGVLCHGCHIAQPLHAVELALLGMPELVSNDKLRLPSGIKRADADLRETSLIVVVRRIEYVRPDLDLARSVVIR